MAELRILTVRGHYFVNRPTPLGGTYTWNGEQLQRKTQRPSVHFHRVEPLGSARPTHVYPPVKMDRRG